MSPNEVFFLVFTLLGGLALFIFGMNIMTEGLRIAVGAKLQGLLSRTTNNKYRGLLMGTMLGATVHSSAATVMLLGFVNAGLMTLGQTVAPIVGANIGTTVSMQAISFRINEYSYVAISIGLILALFFPNLKVKNLGRAILGFGLLFLGMDIMSGAIKPHREILSVYLSDIDGSTPAGIATGVLIAGTLTAVWQSSGATIAIIYSLISAEIFTELSQVFPIVLGAHIGTCATAMLGSIGTNIEARRSAVTHLLFNAFNVTIAIIAMPFFYWLIPLTSSDLIRQTANYHSIVMVVAALIVIPFTGFVPKFVRLITFSKTKVPESSYLEISKLKYPERAIVAVISELQRVLRICSQSLCLAADVILCNFDRATITRIKMNEHVIDDIKLAIREYLRSMTKKYLSRRQIILINHLNSCINDIERIGDHIDQLCDLSLENRSKNSLNKELVDSLFILYEKSKVLLEVLISSMSVEQEYFHKSAEAILISRDDYMQCSEDLSKNISSKVAKHEITSISALYLQEFLSITDRMVKHAENIAFTQRHEDFWIKKSKLEKKTGNTE